MQVTIKGSSVLIGWQYKRLNKKNEPRKRPTTKCFIKVFEGNETTVIAKGKSRVHKGDTFCKNEGRKHSLTRALQALTETNDTILGAITKTERGQIWAAYSQMRGGTFLNKPKRNLLKKEPVKYVQLAKV